MARTKKKKRVYKKIAEATCNLHSLAAKRLLETLDTHEVCVK